MTGLRTAGSVPYRDVRSCARLSDKVGRDFFSVPAHHSYSKSQPDLKSEVVEGGEQMEGSRPRKGQQQHRENYTAFDRAMIAASTSKTPVEFTMAPGETIGGQVCSVDKYFIEVDTDWMGMHTPYRGAKVWISKAMIVTARVITK